MVTVFSELDIIFIKARMNQYTNKELAANLEAIYNKGNSKRRVIW